MPNRERSYLVSVERKVSFFRNGRNQAVRVPKEFEVAVKSGMMMREGTKLIIETAETKPSLKAWLRTLEPLDMEWPKIDDPHPEPVEL